MAQPVQPVQPVQPTQPVKSAKFQLNFLKKKAVIIGIAALIVVLVLAVVFSLWRGEKGQPQVGKIPEATAIVSITKDGFVPKTLSIKSGQTVKWTNRDDSLHRVSSNPHPTHKDFPEFDSKNNIDKGASFDFNFDKPCTYSYHDHLNPQTFQGVISVQ